MGIGQLISDLAVFVPPWALALVGVVLAVFMAPGWLTGLKVKKVKAILRKTVRADDTERKALQDQALELAAGKGEVLLALVREADKLNQPKLRDRALRRLAKLGTHESEVRKFKQKPDPTKEKKFGHPVEAQIFVERLIENGAFEAAKEKLAEALAKFPDDAELQKLQSLVESDEPAASEAG